MAIGNNIMQPVSFTDRLTGRTINITPASQGGYMRAFDDYVASAEASKQKKYDELETRLNENNATTNANYDNNARQAYVDYMRKQRALPGQLQSLGVRGGATESGLLNLYNNYGSSHAANEQQRAADLTTNRQNRDDAWSAYTTAWDEDIRNQYQTAVNNQMNEYNNEITRFSSTVAQYPSTSAGYSAYQQWIANLEASADPLKDIKVALVRQQMAAQFPDGSPSSGGGGGSKSKRSSGGYSSGGTSGGGGNSSAARAAVEAAQARGKAMTTYYSNQKKASNKSSKKSSYRIHGESNWNWQ